MSKSTYERVSEWNSIAGKSPVTIGSAAYYEALLSQCGRIQEELNETLEAIANRDLSGIVDGGCDLDVVVAGLNYLSGSDYVGAINAVLDNNDLKRTTQAEVAYDAAERYTDRGEPCLVYRDDATEFFTVKRTSDDKVMKLPNHPSVDLTLFVPEAERQLVLVVQGVEASKSLIERFQEETGGDGTVIDRNQIEEDAKVLHDLFDEHDHIILNVINGHLDSVTKLMEAEYED